MKKIIAIAMLVALTLSLGMAQAEGIILNKVMTRNVNPASIELMKLQEQADALYGDGLNIEINLIETDGVSVGMARYQVQSEESDNRSWFDKAVDWITFWD